MSILDFMEMSIHETIFFCIVSFIASFAFRGLGMLFAPQKGIAVQTVIGLSSTASLVLIFAAFYAGFSKYIIYGLMIFSLILYISKLKKTQYKQDIILLLFMFVLFLFFIIRIFIWVVPRSGTVEFNCHSTYFASVPLEILKADYFSRLRIIDVYPYEWGKYHFFNGALTSIPLLFFLQRNYLTYLFAKFLTISIFLGAIFEYLTYRFDIKKSLIYFLVAIGLYFTVTFTLITWSAYTNNYAPTLLFMLTWLSFEDTITNRLQNNFSVSYRISCLFSILFTLSAARSIIPGSMLFLFSLYNLWKENKKLSLLKFAITELSTGIFCFLVGLGVLSTIFTGSTAERISFSIHNCVNNVFYFGWIQLFPLGMFFNQPSIFSLHFDAVILFIYLFFIIRNQKKYFDFFHKNMFLCFVLFFLTVLYFYGVYKIIDINRLLPAITFLFVYLLPISCIFFELDILLRIPFLVFVLPTLFQFSILRAGASFPNYCMIAVLCIWIFTKAIMNIFLYKRFYTFLLYILIGLSLGNICINDFRMPFWGSKTDHYTITLPLQNIPYLQEPFEYYTSEDAYLAKLHALKGNRVHYNIIPSRSDPDMYKTSMSMSFLPLGYEEYGVLKINP